MKNLKERMENLKELNEEEISEQEFLKKINDLDNVSEEEIEEVSKECKLENYFGFEKPRYSKNLTDEEAQKVEQIIKWTAWKFWNGSNFHKDYETFDDVHQKIVLKLLEQSVLKDEEGNVLKDKNGEIIIREDQIARNMSEIRFWIKMAAIDCYRFTRRKASREDRNLVIDSQASEDDVESGENKLYRNSEEGREAMREVGITNIEFNQLFNSLLDESNYEELRIKYNLKPRHIEEIKKYIAVKAYHSGINDMKIVNLYKKYEIELDEEKKEMVAECVANKSNGGLTSDVMLKAFFGIGSGINAGSAGRITQNIPVIIKEMISSKLPGYLN